MKLTAANVQTLALPEGIADKVFFDDELPGFGLRLRATGGRRWLVQYDIADGGRRLSRRFVLGSPTILTLSQARAEAKKILAAVRLGRDPVGEKHVARRQRHAEHDMAPRQGLERHAAQKALTFLEQGQEPACYLYRHYHPNGDLLYVGISLEPLRRQDSHLKAATWRDMICHIVIEPFATREQALAAERRAIRKEFPKFNTAHNRQRHPIQELMRRDEASEI